MDVELKELSFLLILNAMVCCCPKKPSPTFEPSVIAQHQLLGSRKLLVHVSQDCLSMQNHHQFLHVLFVP